MRVRLSNGEFRHIEKVRVRLTKGEGLSKGESYKW